MLGSMISGIILSRYVFKSIRIMGVAVLMENVHMICAYWGFVMMALHLGFHWNMFINMIKNKTEKWKNSIWLVVRTLTYGIAIYYTSTPGLLKKYVQMVPPVDDQK